jgi:hypothetical protein
MDGIKSRVAELLAGFKSVEPVATFQVEEARAGGRSVLRTDGPGGEGFPVLGKSALVLKDPVQLPGAAELRALATARGVQDWKDEWAHPETGRVVPYLASDERVDGEGDIVRQDWAFERFAGNPAMPLSHDWGGLPIGKHLDWQVIVREGADYQGPALRLFSMFAPADVSARADEALRLVRAGFMRGGSVGFRSHEPLHVKDPKEREHLGLGKHGIVFQKNELIEFSPCLIPCNQGAYALLAQRKSEGRVRPPDVNLWRELLRRAAVRDAGARDGWAEQDLRLFVMARTLWPAERWEKATDVGRPIVEDSAPAAAPVSGNRVVVVGSAPAPAPEVRDFPGLLRAVEKLVAERADRVESLVVEGLIGLGQQLEDARELLERAEVARGVEGTEARREPARGSVSPDPRVAGLLSRLAALDSAAAGSGKQ